MFNDLLLSCYYTDLWTWHLGMSIWAILWISDRDLESSNGLKRSTLSHFLNNIFTIRDLLSQPIELNENYLYFFILITLNFLKFPLDRKIYYCLFAFKIHIFTPSFLEYHMILKCEHIQLQYFCLCSFVWNIVVENASTNSILYSKEIWTLGESF